MNLKPLAKATFAMAVSAICAESYATEATLNAEDSGFSSSFTNAANWLINGTPSGAIGAALDAGTDYVISGGKTCRTPAHEDATFAGNSLHIGKTSGTGGCLALYAAGGPRVADFSNGDGLVLEKGYLCGWYGKTNIITGKVAVESGSSAPVILYHTGTDSALFLKAAFSGDSSKSLWLATRDTPKNTSWTQKNFVAHFSDNALAGYFGKINCFQCYPSYSNVQASAEWRTEYAATTDSPFPGTLVLGYNCAVRGEDADSMAAVANIDFKSGSCINVVYDKANKKASCVKATSSFAHEGKIRVLFKPGYATGNYPDAMQVPEIAVFKAPVGFTLDEEDFVLETAAFPTIELLVRTDMDGLSTLFLRQPCKVVTNTTTDEGASDQATTSAFISGAHWSDGAIPGTDREYYATKNLRAYSASDEELVFPGRSLAYNGGNLTIVARNVRVDDLKVIAGTLKIYNNKGGAVTLRGSLFVNSGATANVNVYDGRTILLDSEVTGSGTLSVTANTGKMGYVALGEINTNFQGKVKFSHDSANASETLAAFVTVKDGRSLGGPLANWTYNALTIDRHAHLIVTNSVDLNTANRGVFINGPAYFAISNDAVLAVSERITWNGQLTKKGAGTLALGGESPFFTTDGGTTPVAGNNALTVTEGKLRAMSSEAFQGVALSFSPGAALEIAVPEDEADWDTICTYGVKNTLIDTPLVIADAVLPVRIVPADGSMDKPRGLRRVAICTVKTSATQSLGLSTAKFIPESSPYYGSSQTVVESVDAVAGTTTYAIEFSGGTVLFVR